MHPPLPDPVVSHPLFDRSERRLREIVDVCLGSHDGMPLLNVRLSRVPTIGEVVEHDGRLFRVIEVQHATVDLDGRAYFGTHAYLPHRRGSAGPRMAQASRETQNEEAAPQGKGAEAEGSDTGRSNVMALDALVRCCEPWVAASVSRMIDKPSPKPGSAPQIDTATRITICVFSLVGLVGLVYVGAVILLVIGYVFDVPGITHSGEWLTGLVVSAVKVAAMAGTPILALVATGWTVFLVVMFVKHPQTVLAGAVTVGMLAGGVLVTVLVAEAVGQFVAWVLAPVMLGAAGVAGKLASQAASNAGQMAMQAGIASFGPNEAIGATLVTPGLWLLVLLLTNWLGWTGISWLPGGGAG